MNFKNKIVSLDKAGCGKDFFIKELKGDTHFFSRAIGMGLTPGTEIVVLQNFKIGPLIVYLRDSNVALGRKEAKKVMVERVNR